jgi:predicted metalloendopeptidase
VTFARISLVAIAAVFSSSMVCAQQPLPAKPDPVLDVTSMDRSVDPCVDFYTYSCAGWMKNNPIPPDQPSWVAWDKMQDENTGRLHGILEEAVAGGAGRNATMQKIGDYYASCMDEKAVQAAGIKPLQPYLDAIDSLHAKQDLAQVEDSRLRVTVGLQPAAGVMMAEIPDVDPTEWWFQAYMDDGGFAWRDGQGGRHRDSDIVDAAMKTLGKLLLNAP